LLSPDAYDGAGKKNKNAGGLAEHYNKLLGSGTTWPNLPFACVCYELLALNKPDTVRGNMYQVVSQPRPSQPQLDELPRKRTQRRGKSWPSPP
jgi:hypothetical protein